MEHTLCVCDRMPSSFPVRIPQQNRTKQNEARPSLVLHSRIKSRAEALAWLVGLGGRRLVCGETAKETHFCSQVGCSLGELDSGDWATLELLQGWPGVLGPCLFTFSHPLLSAASKIWGTSQFLPSCRWQWNKDRTGHAGTVYPLMVPPAHLHLPKGPLLPLPLCSPRRASCILPHFPTRCLCLW